MGADMYRGKFKTRQWHEIKDEPLTNSRVKLESAGCCKCESLSLSLSPDTETQVQQWEASPQGVLSCDETQGMEADQICSSTFFGLNRSASAVFTTSAALTFVLSARSLGLCVCTKRTREKESQTETPGVELPQVHVEQVIPPCCVWK